MIIFLFFIIICLSIYSYALIDPNLTLVSHPWWIAFRDPMVILGYHMRPISAGIYITLLISLFLLHLYMLKQYKKYSPFKIALGIGGLLLVSYPMFSHDFFNYIFDAKILTFYGKNPYEYMPADFPADEWLRFMHWTHRSYPYGPSFLFVTLIPSFLAFGKFILNFVLFKLLFVISYIVGVYFLEKLHKRWATILATHPLILIEGLVNAHNDMISVTFGIIGVYYLWQKRQIFSRVWLLLSAAVKYLTLPVLILTKDNNKLNILSLCGQIALLFYLTIYSEIQPWYFLPLFIFVPVFPKLIDKIQIFLLGLLLAYYPYIRYGGWDTVEKVQMKHQIIWVFVVLNVLYLLYIYRSALKGYLLKK